MKRSQFVERLALARHKMWCPYEDTEYVGIHRKELCGNAMDECNGPTDNDRKIAEVILDEFMAMKKEHS